MEGQADLAAIGARLAQQLGGILRLGAELGRKMEEGALDLRRLHPHDDADALAAPGLVDDLDDFLLVIDDKGIDVVDPLGGTDHGARLDRMHEIGAGIGKAFADQRDLGQRGRVEMADAGGVEGAQHAWMRIAFDRIEHAAGKELEKALRVWRRTWGRRQ